MLQGPGLRWGKEGRGTGGGGRALGGLRSPRRGGDAPSEHGMKKPRAQASFPGAHGATRTPRPGLFPPQRFAGPAQGLTPETMMARGLLEAAGALDAGQRRRPMEFPFLGPGSSLPGRSGDTLGGGGGEEEPRQVLI